MMKSLWRVQGQHHSFQIIPKVQNLWAAVLANVLMVPLETCLATSIPAAKGGYIPLLLGHLGNAQASLLEYLHFFQNATILCKFLQLLKANHLGELLNELDMYKTPLRLLAV